MPGLVPGIHVLRRRQESKTWMPAFAGMTTRASVTADHRASKTRGNIHD
jgi:hypothetical protein